MAAHAFWGSVRVIARGMALCTILDIMSLGQWEKVMVDAFRIPAKSKWTVAFDAIQRKTGLLMVWVLRGGIVILMTAYTVIANTIKTQICFRSMALYTTQAIVCTHQGKTIGFVQFGNIADQPSLRIMATHAIIAYGLTVYIGMA